MAEERMRRALAEVEAQRDDAIAYLSAIRTVLGVVAQGHGLEASAQEVTRALVQQLGVETCAVVLPTASQSLAVVAAAAQADRLGGTPGGPGEAECLALVRLVDAEGSPTCFRRGADGAFTAVAPAELAGEGCAVLPLVVGAAGRGALVLYWLGGLGQSFGRAHGLGLVADIVGQALTVARARDTTARLCQTLADELGAARTLAETHQRSLSTREAEVEALTAALVRSGRVKEEFLGTVSHELRTPLNAILGYASLLREGMAGPITGEQASLVDRLIASTRNLTALIEDMLFFIQVEADRVLVRHEPIDTRELVEEALAALPERPPAAQVALRVEVAPEAARLTADRKLLRRVLFHLLSNALKFTSEGAVTVSFRGGDGPGAVVLAVRDTGTGIAPERVTEMFELFTQADGSLTRRHDGLGMGLTLIHRCVRLLGGEVLVETALGAGSEFRVLLPDVLPRPTEHAPASSALAMQ